MYNGSIKNHKLFECDNECTVYVAMDKLSICETIQVNTVEPNAALVHESAVTDCTSLIVNDDVVFCDKFENRLRGTVISVGSSVVEVQVVSNMVNITEILSSYVTGFANNGLIHASNFVTLIRHYLICEKAIKLKCSFMIVQ